MPAAEIVVFEKSSEALAQLLQAEKFMQVNVLVFDRPPEPFDEDVVKGPASSIQADAGARSFQGSNPFGAGELAALVGVVNVRNAPTRCVVINTLLNNEDLF